MPNVYRSNIGVEILIDMQQDITAATGAELKVELPDGTTVNWTATIVNTQYLRYVTQTNDLAQSGSHKIQPYFTLGAWIGRGDTVELMVVDHYD